jgi:hypothetical protein
MKIWAMLYVWIGIYSPTRRSPPGYTAFPNSGSLGRAQTGRILEVVRPEGLR